MYIGSIKWEPISALTIKIGFLEIKHFLTVSNYFYPLNNPKLLALLGKGIFISYVEFRSWVSVIINFVKG